MKFFKNLLQPTIDNNTLCKSRITHPILQAEKMKTLIFKKTLAFTTTHIAHLA
jgi:hypothetical protein